MIPIQDKIFLVTGATGKQGGATARHLKNAGANVRALTRNPDSKQAASLRELGIEVVKGNLNEIDSLEPAMQNVYGVFAITNFWERGTGRKEVIQNKHLTDLSKKHHVKHYVYASVARCDDNPGLAHFVTKFESEKYIQQSGLPYTFLRAVYFMDNLDPKIKEAGFHWAALKSVLGNNTTLQMISTSDIGWFAANAFTSPELYLNKSIDIAGDEVNYPQLVNAYRKVFKAEPNRSSLMKFIVMNFMPEIRKMMHWYREPRFNADVSRLRTIHPSMMQIEDYFRQIRDRG